MKSIHFILANVSWIQEQAWWMTYRQALERGGNVRKGERGALVVKYGTFDIKETNTASENGKRKGSYLRGFTIFNAAQIEGIEFPQAQHVLL